MKPQRGPLSSRLRAFAPRRLCVGWFVTAMRTAICPLPTAHCLLPTAFCFLLSAFCLLPPLPTANNHPTDFAPVGQVSKQADGILSSKDST